MFLNNLKSIFGKSESSNTTQTFTHTIVNVDREKSINEYIQKYFSPELMGRHSLNYLLKSEFNKYCKKLKRKNTSYKRSIENNNVLTECNDESKRILEGDLDRINNNMSRLNKVPLSSFEGSVNNALYNLLMISISNMKLNIFKYELEIKSLKESLMTNKRIKNLYGKYYYLYLLMKSNNINIDSIEKFHVLCKESIELDCRDGNEKHYNNLMRALNGLIDFIERECWENIES